MSNYLEIPLTLLRDLLCRHCKKYLSCGPIYTVPDGSVLCGRCYILAKPNYRNYAYETIAKCFVYPCCYWSKYCSRILHWNESLEHERNCVYNSTVRLLCTHPTVLFRSERKIPDIPVRIIEILRDDVFDQLKCVNCDGYLSCEPIYICQDGKNICHRCTISNGLPQYSIRNLPYERLANCFIFPCSYRYRGCPIRLKFGRNLWQHESECPYGPINKKSTPAKRSNSNKNGKERGVIQTHSGHVYGTITPHTALFAPPQKPHYHHHNDESETCRKKSSSDEDVQSIPSTVGNNDEVSNETKSINGFNLHLYHYPAFYIEDYDNRAKLKHTPSILSSASTVQRKDSLNQEIFEELKARQMQRHNESIYNNSNNL